MDYVTLNSTSAISGRTAWCRCKFRCLSKKTL